MTLAAPNPLDEAQVRRVFLIEIADARDSVVRVLDAFALGGARLAGLDLSAAGEALHLRVIATGLDPIRAQRIQGRLAAMPIVQGVATGWVSS